MSAGYQAVLWNRQKRIYDAVMLSLVALYLMVFTAANILYKPEITVEMLVIRATGSLAIIMLHVILMIGPLSRLNKKFLPLLYNRRHLGVTMFLIALTHGSFCVFQFHALGNINPILSIFVSNTHYDSLVNFPFQTLGFTSLIVLFLMAATSHDFWLHNLSARVWKSLHMMVYAAYALLIMHVMMGVIQLESSPVYVAFLTLGMMLVISLHLIAGFKEWRNDHREHALTEDGWMKVCDVNEIRDNRAKIISSGKETIAIFKYGNKLSAVSNVCRHQGGPLGEGKIVDGCITCPWHGYQYLPHNGCSPPPFTEKVETFDVTVRDDMVYVNPKPHPEGTEVEPATV